MNTEQKVALTKRIAEVIITGASYEARQGGASDKESYDVAFSAIALAGAVTIDLGVRVFNADVKKLTEVFLKGVIDTINSGAPATDAIVLDPRRN